MPFVLWPDLNRMAGQSLMAVFASIIDTAAPQFDCDDIERCVVVQTAGLRV